MKTGYFWCQNGHVYSFGDEEWHYEDHAHQCIHESGVPIPRYCQHDTCMDSMSIVGPFETAEEAQDSYDNRGAFYR